ncbi:hypothetical protein QEN19_000309 [Hanseniaspora menglaensis]
MNFITNIGSEVTFNNYEPHKFDNENFRSSRNKSELYNFPTKNPFDENINWKEFTKNYEDGTLNHDYKIRYKPALKYIEALDSIEINSAKEKNNVPNLKDITKINNNVDLNSATKEVAENFVVLQNSRPLQVENNKNKPKVHLGIFKINKKITIQQNGSKEVLLDKKPNFFFTFPKYSEKLANNKFNFTSKKQTSALKITFYTTTGCTAVASTAILIVCATAFPLMIPAVLPILLPTSVVSSGIVLFKAKRIVSKAKKNIHKDIKKFKIDIDGYKQSLKLNSKKVIKSLKLNDVFKPKKINNQNYPEKSPFLDEIAIYSVLNDDQEQINPFKHLQLSTKSQDTNTKILNKRSTRIKKKKTIRKYYKSFEASSSEEEHQDTIKSSIKDTILEKYLKPEAIPEQLKIPEKIDSIQRTNSPDNSQKIKANFFSTLEMDSNLQTTSRCSERLPFNTSKFYINI